MQTLALTIIYAGAMLLALLLVWLGWQRRYYRGGRTFSLMMAALAFWFGCHILAMNETSLAGTLRWMTLQYGGIVLLAPTWLLFALAYSGLWWRTTRWMRRSVFIIPALLYAVALTNESHGLWWSSATVDLKRSYVYLYTTNGPLFWVHVAYSYLCTVTGIGLLTFATFRLGGTARYYARLVLLAALVPPIANIIYLNEVGAVGGEDPTPFLSLLAGLMIFYAMIRYRAVDLAPIAEREIFSLLPDGVLVLDVNHTVATHNALAAQMLGVPIGYLLGQPVLEAAKRSPFVANLRQVLEQSLDQETHLINYEQDGAPRGLEIRTRPLQTRNGAVAGTLLVLRDTTERLLLEQARERNLAQIELVNRLSRAANSASATQQLVELMAHTLAKQGWWERVMVGAFSPEGRIEVVADAADGEQNAWLGESTDASQLAELHAASTGHAAQIISATDEQLSPGFSRLLAEAGVRKLILVPLNSQQQPLGLLALGNRDERPIPAELVHLAETVGELMTDAIIRIRLYEEVQQTNSLKSSFLATMSHELRTPLTSIIGYVDMLQRGTYGQPGERMREPLAFMRYSSVTLLNLINDILDFSRMEAGFLSIDLQPVNATRALYNVIGTLRPQIEEKHLKLELFIELDLPPVQANTARLEQVISNLLSNAVKFTPGGTITVRAQRHEAGIRISISDTGIGIAPEEQEQIFKEFHRVEQRQARKVGGTGLGLAISRRLAHLMQGNLSLESTPLVGSTFHLDLRLAVLNSADRATVAEPVRR
jgi:PAS domain S-box-containing protein